MKKNCFLPVAAGILAFVLPATARAASEPPPAREILARVAGVMEEAAGRDTMLIRNVQARFVFELGLANDIYQALKGPLSGILNREFLPTARGSGFIHFDPGATTEGGNSPRTLLEVSSNQFAFLLLRDGPEITLFSPQLNAMVRDNIDRFSRAFRENSALLPGLPGVKMPATRTRLPGNGDVPLTLRLVATALRRAADTADPAEKATVVPGRNKECFRLTLPAAREGRLTLDVYADSYVPAFARLVDATGDRTLELTFSDPAGDPVAPDHYLPAGASFSGRHNGSRVSIRANHIRYNPPVEETGFALRETNLDEFMGVIYLRALSGIF